jgi:hypothetical protein
MIKVVHASVKSIFRSYLMAQHLTITTSTIHKKDSSSIDFCRNTMNCDRRRLFSARQLVEKLKWARRSFPLWLLVLLFRTQQLF